MGSHRPLHSHRIVVLACFIVILASLGDLALARQIREQPVPTDDDGPPIIVTVPAGVPTLTPTPAPTRPPRVSPTPVPTLPPRDAPPPSPTLAPRVTPTSIPSTEPPLDPEPTAMPAQPPTTIPLQPIQDQPGGDDTIPMDPSVFSPFPASTIVNVTRLCPHTFNPFTSLVTVATLQAICKDRPERTLYYEWGFGGPPGHFKNDDQGNGAVFQVPADEGNISITPMDGLQQVAVACATFPPRTQAKIVPFRPAPFDNTIKLTTKLFKTTWCTWYLYAPQAVADVAVHAWQCPAGYDLLAVGATPAIDCAIPIDGVRAVIYTDVLSDLSYYGDTGADGPGLVVLDAVPPDAYELYILESTLPAPGGSLAASCDGAPLAAGYKLLPVIPPGANLDCDWYWVPPTP